MYQRLQNDIDSCCRAVTQDQSFRGNRGGWRERGDPSEDLFIPTNTWSHVSDSTAQRLSLTLHRQRHVVELQRGFELAWNICDSSGADRYVMAFHQNSSHHKTVKLRTRRTRRTRNRRSAFQRGTSAVSSTYTVHTQSWTSWKHSWLLCVFVFPHCHFSRSLFDPLQRRKKDDFTNILKY